MLVGLYTLAVLFMYLMTLFDNARSENNRKVI